MLAGALTAEDEEAVQEELDEIIKQSLPNVPEGAKDLEKEVLDLPAVPAEEPHAPVKVKAKAKKEPESVALPA